MDVYWLEQSEADVPEDGSWLSEGEAVCLSRLRFAKRRGDWRLGRWTAKRALAACLKLPSDLAFLASVEIKAALSGAPEVFLFSKKATVNISLSHRLGTAICAVALSGDRLGCDLEMVEPRSDAFVADYFTTHEQALVERASAEDKNLLTALIWSGKESALKALHEGLRLDTRCMEVGPIGVGRVYGLPEQVSDCQPSLASAAQVNGWRQLQVRYEETQVFPGWWRHENHLVRTIVSPVLSDSCPRPLSAEPIHPLSSTLSA